MNLTKENVFSCLSKVIDPELHVDIVSMGLVYDVILSTAETKNGTRQKIYIVMTLTTPGCPLAGVLQQMVKSELSVLEGIDVSQDVDVEITFDPPWIPDMMSEEVRAELGY